ncbi:MAG TPA: hypothetical protein PLN86_15640 [Candidatus Hydrogenedentes bacterium]|nr:hypothetical protein [Candidatus Hydrogenedentota bacterium]
MESVQVSGCIGLQAATMSSTTKCIGACAGWMGSDSFRVRDVSPFGWTSADWE